MGKVLTVHSGDVTNLEFNCKITCSDDPGEHMKYHIRSALMYAANGIVEAGLSFPLKLSLGTVEENMNVKLALTIEEIEGD